MDDLALVKSRSAELRKPTDMEVVVREVRVQMASLDDHLALEAIHWYAHVSALWKQHCDLESRACDSVRNQVSCADSLLTAKDEGNA